VLTKEFAPLASDIPADLRAIVEKALQKLPENRYESAAAMRADLEKALNRLNNPTFAKTEVLDAASLATEVSRNVDPDATVVRPAGTPAVAVPFAADDSVVTRVEVTVPERASPSHRPAVQAGAAPLLNFTENMSSRAQLVIVAGGLVLGALIISLLIGLMSQRQPSSTHILANTSNTNTRALAVNTPNAPTNTTNMAVPTNASNTASSYASNVNSYGNSHSGNTSSPSNTNAADGTRKPNVVPSGATFCEGYEFGWKETFESKGKTVPPTPPCPNPLKYRESLRDGFGGQVAGTLDAMGRINGKK
jgi:serine/threonine protein kinase